MKIIVVVAIESQVIGLWADDLHHWQTAAGIGIAHDVIFIDAVAAGAAADPVGGVRRGVLHASQVMH